MANAFAGLDHWLFLIINTGMGRPWLDGIMLSLTFLGTWTVGLITLGVLSDCDRRTFWRVHMAALLAAALIAVPLNSRLKQLVGRDRPCAVAEHQTEGCAFVVRELEVKTRRTRSFPSGHSAMAFFFMTYAALYRRSCRGWCYTLAALIAFSRVYVGQHFPSDCVAGALLGGLEGRLAWTVGQRWFRPRFLPAADDGAVA